METFTAAQQFDLLQRLTNLTSNSKLSWDREEGSDYAFSCETGKIAYVLRSQDEDDFEPFELTIYVRRNPLGDFEPFQSINSARAQNSEFSRLLNSLYQDVKRRVLNLDSLAADVFKELDELS